MNSFISSFVSSIIWDYLCCEGSSWSRCCVCRVRCCCCRCCCRHIDQLKLSVCLRLLKFFLFVFYYNFYSNQYFTKNICWLDNSCFKTKQPEFQNKDTKIKWQSWQRVMWLDSRHTLEQVLHWKPKASCSLNSHYRKYLRNFDSGAF